MRAAAVRPGFDVDETALPQVRLVVRALDGMPLALELAAARLRTLSLTDLADGLSDRFRLLTTGNRTALPRHRTLRAVIAWSWDLLGSLSLTDEIFIDVRWIDLHLRRGDAERAIVMIDGVRQRALRSATPELVVMVDILEAGAWLRLGELDRARALIEPAQAALTGESPFTADHGVALLGSVQAVLCLELGDPAGAEAALTRAYAAAVLSRDMPILSIVAVTAARLAEQHGRPADVALLLGAAARLRGTHDRSDPEIRDMTRRGRAALGEAAFTDAYQRGWHLDGKTAAARVDPAWLRRELDGPAQARRL